MAEHPITPPPELVQQWRKEWRQGDDGPYDFFPGWLAARAAQWGADQELKACCDWIAAYPWLDHTELMIKQLRAARRPKPPSLKQQALEAFDRFTSGNNDIGNDMRDCKTIRQALEALPND